MNLLKPYECHHCGVVDEAQFEFSGPHIKQVCNHCGAYVKFISKSQMPDARETKLRIWGVERNMMYWRLYLCIKKGSEVSA